MWKLMRFLFKVGFLALLLAGAQNGDAVATCGPVPPLPPSGLEWPVRGAVVNGYSLNCSTDSGHRGIDINAASGSAVAAGGGGVVAFVGYTPAEGGGITISIDHQGGLRSTYLHLAEAAVAKGQTVTQGQILGKLGTMPLHFGLKLTSDGDMYFNPLELLPASAESAPPAEPSALSPETHPEPALNPSPSPPQPQPEAGPERTAATNANAVTHIAGSPSSAPVYSSGVAADAPTGETFSYREARLFDQASIFAPNSGQEPLAALQFRGDAGNLPIPYSEYPHTNTSVKHEKDGGLYNERGPWVEQGAVAAAAAALLFGGLLASSFATPLKELRRPAYSSPTARW